MRALAEMEGEYLLRLTGDARELLESWEAEIEAMLAEGGRMEIMPDWGAKLAGATLRLAAVLHCVEHGPHGYMERRTLAAAIEIGRYLIPHADAVLNMMLARDDSSDSDARYVLRWIERHGRREFTRREAQQHGKWRFRKANDIDPALTELVRRGYVRLRPAEVTGLGRPPSPRYEVNPAVFETWTPEFHSHNSQNSVDVEEEGISGNIENAFQHSGSQGGLELRKTPEPQTSKIHSHNSHNSQNSVDAEEDGISENIENAFGPFGTTERVQVTV